MSRTIVDNSLIFLELQDFFAASQLTENTPHPSLCLNHSQNGTRACRTPRWPCDFCLLRNAGEDLIPGMQMKTNSMRLLDLRANLGSMQRCAVAGVRDRREVTPHMAQIGTSNLVRAARILAD